MDTFTWAAKDARELLRLSNLPMPAHRFYLVGLSGGSLIWVAPGAGGVVDGVASRPSWLTEDLSPDETATYHGGPPRGYPTWPFLIEAASAFSAGAALKTDADGRAVAQGGSGIIVAVALEAASDVGDLVLCKWL